jgi:nucleoside-diphosphate-sugar epimerase
MAAKKKVVITGGAGLIGSILISKLSDRYDFTSLDLREAKGARSIVGDLSDFDRVKAAFEGHDAVVHLAADPAVKASWDSALKNNFVSTYNVFEAAKQAGMERVVFASSQHAVGGFYLDEPWKLICEDQPEKLTPGQYPLIDETCPIRPDGYYGTSKAYGEALGSYYNDYHGLSSIHIRIGWVISTDKPDFSAFALSLWLSHRDVAQIMDKALAAPKSLRYGVYFAMSDNVWKIFDISKAKRELGYAPQDAAGRTFTPGPAPKRDR